MIATIAALIIAPAAPKPKLLIVDSLVVGQYVGGKWKLPPENYESRSASLSCRVVGIGSLGKTFASKGVVSDEITGGSYTEDHTLGNDTSTKKGRVPDLVVAVANMNPRVPRKVQQLSTKSATYQKAADDFLKSKGLPTPASIRRVVSCDLDGDGTREVLIEARNIESAFDPSDEDRATYSFVILRSVKGNAAKTDVLGLYNSRTQEKSWEAPLKLLRAVADLNGDGRMEVVTSEDYHEGQGASLWSFSRGKLQRVLHSGAGV